MPSGLSTYVGVWTSGSFVVLRTGASFPWQLIIQKVTRDCSFPLSSAIRIQIQLLFLAAKIVDVCLFYGTVDSST